MAKSALELREFTPAERKAYWKQQADRYKAPEPSYGFVGRDLDVLEVERRLLIPREGKLHNILLIRGMGGSGKTTLLRHLMEWWQTTGFVQKVFYFGYDERAWRPNLIQDMLAQGLLTDELDTFRSLSPVAQQKRLGQKMRSERHLLVLDNMESITGSSLAIKNTLLLAEQKELQSFLAELEGGETMTLLGSRGSEEWLMGGSNAPLRPNDIYNLPGLDRQAASTLADRVLERHVGNGKKREEFRQSDEFQELLKLLDGYPLPIQVVLANLAQQTPSEVLKVLREGGIVQDSAIQSKSESILICIDYSFSNLSPADQMLLICLAPFTGVVSKSLIKKYTEYLKKYSVLAQLPFERLDDVLDTAQKWGLVTPDDLPGYLRLQPVLPYILRTRLNQDPRSHQAIEMAYRQCYNDYAPELWILMHSGEPRERQFGQMLAKQEFDNLVKALELNLMAHASVFDTYSVLSDYIDSTGDQKRGLDLGRMVLKGIENYNVEEQRGKVGCDLTNIVEDIGLRQLNLRMYEEAETSFQRALKMNDGLAFFANELLVFDAKLKLERKSVTLYHLGILYEDQGNYGLAENYYKKALEIEVELDNRHSQASTYYHLGNLAARDHEYEQSETHLQKALEIYTEYDDRYEQADIFHTFGLIAEFRKQWQQAEQNYTRALNIFIEFNDRDGQARAYHQLGSLAHKQRQWIQAEQHYKKALEIIIELNDYPLQGKIYNNLGLLKAEQKQWQQADNYYKKALDISIRFNDCDVQAAAYTNLGIAARENCQWQEAQQYFQKAKEIYVGLNDRYNEAEMDELIGSMAIRRFGQELNPSNMAAYYESQLKALKIYVELGDDSNRERILLIIAHFWKSTGDYEILDDIAPILGVTNEEAENILKSFK